MGVRLVSAVQCPERVCQSTVGPFFVGYRVGLKLPMWGQCLGDLMTQAVASDHIR